MALTEDLNNSNELKELFALDKVLRNLNLWRGPVISGKSDEERKAAIEAIDFSQGFVLNGASFDPDGLQIINVTSETTYDEENGLLNDKIIFWKHSPYDQSEGKETSDHYVIAMQYKRDAYQDESGVPVMVPDQIWVNGSQIFNSTMNGGANDPTQPKFRRLIDRVVELSQRVKETLSEREPAENLAMILADGREGDNILKEISGGSPFLEGLSEAGGFAQTLTPFFLDVIQEDGETLQLNCKSIDDLKAVHGFHVNTIDQGRTLQDVWEKSATHMESGVRFTVRNEFEFNEETGRYVFKLNCFPENPPSDVEAPEQIEIARLEYEYNEEGLFELKDWNFMESDKEKFQSLSSQQKLLGLYQTCLNYLNKGKYPPIHDIVYQVELDDVISEFHTPPTLAEGHECLWLPFNGRNLDKQAGPGGDNLGGGNAFSMRYKKDDGSWSVSNILIDIPYQPFGSKGDWEGMQPDFKAIWENTDTIFLTHDHFDHATLEFLAYQGLMKGKKVICDEAIEHIVRQRMSTLGVKKEDFPMFVNFDDPGAGFIKKDDGTYIYNVTDNDGNTRGKMQICPKGALHTAQVDTFMFTPCFNDDQFGETYFTYGDSYEISKKGKIFAAEGQLGLLRDPSLSDETKARLIEQTVPMKKEGGTYKKAEEFETQILRDLAAQYPDRDFERLYIAMHDPTNCTQTGHAPRPEAVKDTWRELLKLCDDELVFHVPFSTNIAEISAMDQVISEAGTLRNSTDVGGNMETRGSVLNMFGADPDLDLRTVKIPAEKHPKVLYDLSLEAVGNFLSERESLAVIAAEKRKDGKTDKELLAEDKPYQAMSVLKAKAEAEIKAGNDKPQILHDCFLVNNNEEIWRELYSEAGFDINPNGPQPDFGYFKKLPLELFDDKKSEIKAETYRKLDIATLQEENPDFNFDSVVDYWSNKSVDYWCLKSVLDNGEIQFDKLRPCTRNDKRMYDAIMNDQDEASIHHSRTSKIGKFFRNFADNLLIRTTGPFGTAEEQFATLYRYAYGDSLLDYDEFVRNTGYQINDDTPKTLFVTQTPSTGHAAQIAQEKLMRTIVQNKNDTIFCATKNGFKVYNPKEKLTPMLTQFKALGWNAEWDSRNNQIHVHDVPFHVHGHGFRDDLRDTVKACRAKMHTVIHNPGWENYMVAREVIEQEGGNFDSSDMKDFVGIKAEYDDESGELKHNITDVLTPSYWLVRIRRKYGQMYGGVVEMMRAIVLRDDGDNKLSGTRVRRSGPGNSQGTFDKGVTHQAKTDFTQASNMDHSARASEIGVSHANIRSPENPKSPGVAQMIAAQLKQRKIKPQHDEQTGGLDYDV